MIFSKNAIFPYPVLKNELDDYTENIFNLEVDLKDNTNEFIFEITYEIGSDYIKNLIDTKKAAFPAAFFTESRFYSASIIS